MKISIYKQALSIIFAVDDATREETENLRRHLRLREEGSIPIGQILSARFGTHGTFFTYLSRKTGRELQLDEEDEEEYNFGGYNFSNESSGFSAFLYDQFGVESLAGMTGGDLDILITICMDYLLSVSRPEMVANIELSPLPDDETSRSKYFNFTLREADLLFTKDGVYEVLFRKKKGIPDVNLIKNEVSNKLIQTLNQQLDTQYEAYKQQVAELEQRYRGENQPILKEGFRLGLAARGEWSMDGDKVAYKNIIYMKEVVKNKVLYRLTEKDSTRFFISGLYIKFAPTIPHVYIHGDYRHPNASSHKLCMGTLSGKPIEIVLRNVVSMAERGNLDSAWDGGAATTLARMIEAGRVTPVTTESGDGKVMWDSGGGWS